MRLLAGRRLLLAIAVAALALTTAGIAAAACGGTYTSKPRKTVNPKGRAPIALGDSVMILSIKGLAKHGYHANAHGCRQWYQGVDIIKQKRRANHLPHLLTMALGSNGEVTQADINFALRALPKNKVLAMVTPRSYHGSAGQGAKHMRHAAKRHPHRILLLDWVKYSARHKGAGGWFGPDGLHLTYPGAAAYARFLSKAIPFAKGGRYPDGAHFPRH